MVGRPPLYDSPEKLQEKIDEYFDENRGPHATITGLAYHLGFCDRQSLYDYEERPEFSCIVKRARLRVEMAYETKLSGQSVTGAIFALKNMGWKDKSEIDQTVRQAPTLIEREPKPEDEPIN